MTGNRYQTYSHAPGDWRWRLRAGNGRILASGEGFTREADAERAIDTHRRAAATEQIERLGTLPPLPRRRPAGPGGQGGSSDGAPRVLPYLH